MASDPGYARMGWGVLKEVAFGKFLDLLENDDDVQEVIHNADGGE